MAVAHAPENGHLFWEKRHSQIRPLRTTGFLQTSAQALISALYPKRSPPFAKQANKRTPSPPLGSFLQVFLSPCARKVRLRPLYVLSIFSPFFKMKILQNFSFSSLKGTLINILSNTLPWTKHPFFDVTWTRCLLK